jgi:SAM-dependent methyltransferase
MRPHVLEFVRVALGVFVPGRATRVVEVGSYAVEDGTAKPGESVREVVAAVCPGSEFLGVDMRAGPGVDLVADLERPGNALEAHFGRKEVVISVDTFEHVRRPWVAMKSVYDLLRPNGLAIFAVPFTFQIHEHPHDYYRYTQEGLDALLRTYFHDVWTAQDPPDSKIPHTVVAVARRGFPLTEAEEKALEAACAKWQTKADAFMPTPTLPTAFLQFPTPETMDRVMRQVRRIAGAVSETLEQRYERLCAEPSDINEHLPVLRELASACSNVAEFGTRGGVSTTALLMGLRDKVRAKGGGGFLKIADIDYAAVGNALAELGPSLKGDAVWLQGEVGDTLAGVTVDSCDMLFIDTLHTYDQLITELDMYHDRVDKWIALHDTVTFGAKGEDGKEPGLRQAVADFLSGHSEWSELRHYENNNGLTVLERVS